MEEEKRIVFYDGDCGFCNRSVQFILKRNTSQPLLYFASLQSEFTQHFFDENNEPTPNLSSLIFFENGLFYYKSTAALKISNYLNSYKWVKIGLIFPRFFRDWIYDLIAKNRHRIVSSNQCELIQTKDRARFIS